MEHDHVLKILNFDLLTPSQRLGGGRGSAGKIFATMSAYVVVRTKGRRFCACHRTDHTQRVRANGLCVGSMLTARH